MGGISEKPGTKFRICAYIRASKPVPYVCVRAFSIALGYTFKSALKCSFFDFWGEILGFLLDIFSDFQRCDVT